MAGEGRPKPHHLDQKDNLADLIARIDPADRKLYESLGFIYTEAAFVNRRFVVITTQGKGPSGPRSPSLEVALRVTGFHCDARKGSTITLVNETTQEVLQVGHVPVRLFGYPVFVSVPIYQGVRWEAREQPDGSYTRALVFGICFKQQSHIRFYNRGNVAVVTPNEYRSHFGDTLPRY